MGQCGSEAGGAGWTKNVKSKKACICTDKMTKQRKSS